MIKSRSASITELLSAHDFKTPHEIIQVDILLYFYNFEIGVLLGIVQFELRNMNMAEREQTSFKDRFWGFDKEAADCVRERKNLLSEDRRSKKHEAYCKHIQKLSNWRKEELDDQTVRAMKVLQHDSEKRAAYMSFFMNATSTNDIKNYSWRSGSTTNEHIEDNGDPFLVAFYGHSFVSSAGMICNSLKH